ncbi:host attachment protein [Novosphingobium tardum]|uniref:Host attachment protein n=1 Tax=Novosphingobium tardum TaxID=1538021 RepID=A0ABV8RLL0_9SPHN
MQLPHKAHVAIVDGERFVLMRNTGTALEPVLSAQDTPEIELTNYSAGVQHQDGRGQQAGKQNLDEFAHAAGVAEWLNKAVLGKKISDLFVVADPTTLGEMRRHYHKQLEGKLVGELAKTLTGEPAERIAAAISAA